MTPILRGALVAALAALAAAPVFSQPPQPEAPFDLNAPPGLLPEELSYLQSVDGGRYTLQGSGFQDSKAGAPLSNAAAEPLLRARSAQAVSDLRAKQKAGSLQAADRRQALLLYWYRASLLSPEDRRFLESLNPLALGRAPPEPGQEGEPSALGSGEGSAAAASGSDDLLARFSRQVSFDGSPEEKAALTESAALLLGTPTGRQLAEEFVAAGAKARVSFVQIPNSRVYEENGKKVISASGGYTDAHGDVIQISLNRDYMGTDPGFRNSHMTPTLGHELLGHGLESARAKKAGVFDVYNGYYRENEANAGIVGWIVQAEMGAKLDDGHMWRYLKDPEEYHSNLKTNLPYYSTTFSPEDMKKALPVLGERLADAQKALADIPKSVAAWEAWRPVIQHFISIHKMAEAAFHSLLEAIENGKKSLLAHGETLKAIAAHIEQVAASFSGDDGAARLRGVQEQFSRDFFAQEEQRLLLRRARLEEVARGKRYEVFSPPAPGQVTWDELRQMYDKDRKDNPKHWNR